MLIKLAASSGPVIGFRATGTLTAEDYAEVFAPEVEKLTGMWDKIDLLVNLEGFDGWETAFATELARFGKENQSQVDRVAVISDDGQKKRAQVLSGYFPLTESRFFDHAGLDEAWQWLREHT